VGLVSSTHTEGNVALSTSDISRALRKLPTTNTVGTWLIAELGVNEILQWYFDDPDADWLDTAIDGWRQIFALRGDDIRDAWDVLNLPTSHDLAPGIAEGLITSVSSYLDAEGVDPDVVEEGPGWEFEEGLLITPTGEEFDEAEIELVIMEPMVITSDAEADLVEIGEELTDVVKALEAQVGSLQAELQGYIDASREARTLSVFASALGITLGSFGIYRWVTR
jgi:hypothetical protein